MGLGIFQKQNYVIVQVISQQKLTRRRITQHPPPPIRNNAPSLRLFPSIALRIPTTHNFMGDKHAHWKMAAFSLRLDLAEEVNRHFLVNDYGDLVFAVVLN